MTRHSRSNYKCKTDDQTLFSVMRGIIFTIRPLRRLIMIEKRENIMQNCLRSQNHQQSDKLTFILVLTNRITRLQLKTQRVGKIQNLILKRLKQLNRGSKS